MKSFTPGAAPNPLRLSFADILGSHALPCIALASAVRVSVIVPTRNRAGTLARTVAGVRSQGHADVELIVVDDGSSPDQAALNERIAGAGSGSIYVRLPATESRGSGPSHARNAGMAAATGELVAFCDDDDAWCAADYLETAVAEFAARPELDVFFGNQEAVFDGATRYATWQPRLEAAVAARHVAAGGIVTVSKAECLVSAGDFAHMNTCVFRKTLLDAIDGFDVDVRYCEDLDLFVRAVDRARAVAYLRRTVAIHHVPDRRRHDNASTQLDEHGKALTLHLLATRLAAACAGAEALAYGRRLDAQACRTLARQAAKDARLGDAITWARLAGARHATPGWTLYACWLSVRHACRRARGTPDRARGDASGTR